MSEDDSCEAEGRRSSRASSHAWGCAHLYQIHANEKRAQVQLVLGHDLGEPVDQDHAHRFRDVAAEHDERRARLPGKHSLFLGEEQAQRWAALAGRGEALHPMGEVRVHRAAELVLRRARVEHAHRERVAAIAPGARAARREELVLQRLRRRGARRRVGCEQHRQHILRLGVATQRGDDRVQRQPLADIHAAAPRHGVDAQYEPLARQQLVEARPRLLGGTTELLKNERELVPGEQHMVLEHGAVFLVKEERLPQQHLREQAARRPHVDGGEVRPAKAASQRLRRAEVRRSAAVQVQLQLHKWR